VEISDITKSNCKLKWKPPEDDGGSPIEYYEIEKYDVATDMWLPAGSSETCEATVKGLTEGKQYRFRVRAVNRDGEGPDAEADETITAKNPFDPPGKPDRPVPLDWGTDFCELKWRPPKEDGGSPITGYIIEMRQIGKREWKEVIKSNEKTLNGRVEAPKIQEGEEYEFRVIAVNKAGPSVPSDPSEVIKAENRFQKPRIDRSTLHKKTLFVGQLLRVDADYTGAPEPSITWFSPNGDVLKSDDYYNIDASDFHTHMYVRNIQRKDTGIYKIRAKNSEGEDNAEVEILVVTVPSAPLGPIEVSDITCTSCHLSWRPPADDGGDPIKYYTVERMDPERGNWIPCGETNGKTPEFDAEGLQEGTTYYFRVRAVNGQGESEPLETDALTLIKNPYDPPGPPENVKLKDWDKRWVKLTWEKPQSDGGARITHYIIEKKEVEYSNAWVKAVVTETDDLEYKVTDLTENTKYRYNEGN
jgi:predicted RNA-binding protein with TRAM domain